MAWRWVVRQETMREGYLHHSITVDVPEGWCFPTLIRLRTNCSDKRCSRVILLTKLVWTQVHMSSRRCAQPMVFSTLFSKFVSSRSWWIVQRSSRDRSPWSYFNLGLFVDSEIVLSTSYGKTRVFINKTLSTETVYQQDLINRDLLSTRLIVGKVGPGMWCGNCNSTSG